MRVRQSDRESERGQQRGRKSEEELQHTTPDCNVELVDVEIGHVRADEPVEETGNQTFQHGTSEFIGWRSAEAVCACLWAWLFLCRLRCV